MLRQVRPVGDFAWFGQRARDHVLAFLPLRARSPLYGVLSLCALLVVAPARADEAKSARGASAAGADVEAPAVTDPPTIGTRALAGAASVVPGAVVHGSGHYVLGETDTATDLLLFEALGLGMIFGGGAVIALTGASRYVVGPAAAVTILGVGTFGLSLAADVYGSVSPDPGAALLRPPHLSPVLESELGYRRVEDPLFRHRDFLVERVTYNRGPLGIGFSGWFSADGDNARYRAEGAYRFFDDGDGADSTPRDRLELELGFVHHRYLVEHFDMTSAEIGIAGRYDLSRVGRTLAGSFVELGVGYGHGLIQYDVPGHDIPRDDYMLLLSRFGFGVTLRGASGPGSEALLYYDHRHDDFAAGLKITGLGSGVAGHFGFRTRWFFNDVIGVSGDVSVGSAWVFGGSLVLRQSAPARESQHDGVKP